MPWHGYGEDVAGAAVRSLPPTPGVHATWLGHSTVLLRLGGVRVLTDPLLSEAFGLPLQVQRLDGRYGARRV